MKRSLVVALLAIFVIMTITSFGCKGRMQKAKETVSEDTAGLIVPTQEMAEIQPVEVEEVVIVESPAAQIPAQAPTPIPMPQDIQTKNKQIQAALKNAGFYTGAIDGIVGPKTKAAIEEFQKAKGLKADGKVGPKTWAELSKYITNQEKT
jgi:hypothetical protein